MIAVSGYDDVRDLGQAVTLQEKEDDDHDHDHDPGDGDRWNGDVFISDV